MNEAKNELSNHRTDLDKLIADLTKRIQFEVDEDKQDESILNESI